MKVAYLVNQYPAVSHTFIRREILELERRGHEVLRLTMRKSNCVLVDTLDQDEARRTVSLLDTPWTAAATIALKSFLGGPGRFFRALRSAWRLARVSRRGLVRHVAYFMEAVLLAHYCRCHAVRHVHVHFGSNSASVALMANRLSGLSYSFTVHGTEELDAPATWSLQEKVSRGKFVVAISHFGRAQLFRWTEESDWRKIHVVHCAVDDVFFDEARDVDENADTLVCVGRLSPEKGHVVLLDAFQQAVNEGLQLRLLLVGDGQLREAIEQHVEEHGLSSRVQICGWLSGQQVRTALLRSRGLILPSFAEGLPVVIMEALALGRPVITTFVGGIPELVRDGVNGWLIPAGDVEALKGAIHRIGAASSAELTEMGHKGAQSVRAAHRLCTEVGKLERCLMEVC
jgi:glycosyltransferase involved in cell wall biosynthesis